MNLQCMSWQSFMTRHAGLWLLLACLLAGSRAMGEGTPPDFGEQAARAFDQGDFAGAASAYESAVKTGVVNGHLYYNLGIVYFRQGRIGDAMAAFLAARRFLPRDPDVAANVRFVLAGIHDKLEPETPKPAFGRLDTWTSKVTTRELAITTSLLFTLAGLALSVTAVVPSLRRLRIAAGASFIVPILAAVSLSVKWGDDKPWGAVTAKPAKVYSGPGEHNTAIFELQEGAPVLVTDTARGGYYRIELSDGKRGWIPDSQVRVFGPL